MYQYGGIDFNHVYTAGGRLHIFEYQGLVGRNDHYHIFQRSYIERVLSHAL